MNAYKFVRHNRNYQKRFEREKLKLRKIIPNAEIEHIGSTAVNGLGGKGILDILISVPKKDINEVKKGLAGLNYKLSRTAGDKERIFFEKNCGLFKRKKIHLHLTPFNSKIYKDAVKFRDTLRKNPKLREEYSVIKQKAVSLGKKDKSYRDFKEKFIKEVLKK